MLNRKHKLALIAGTLVTLGLNGPVFAGGFNTPAFEDELNVCVAAVRERIDYDGAIKVSHRVTSVEPRGAGYILGIDTEVFESANAEPAQTLTTACRAQGSERLITVEIQDTTAAYFATN